MHIHVLLTAIFLSCFGLPAAFGSVELDPKEVSATIENSELVVRRLSDGEEVNRLPLTKVSKGTRFFHWTQPENQSRWASQGYMDKGEMDFLSTPSGTKQVYGPGFYVSTDPLDSKSYGPKGVYAEAPRDFYLLKDNLRSTRDTAVKGTHEVLKSAGVYGNQATDTWRVFFDEDAVSNLKPTDMGVILDELYRLDSKPIDHYAFEKLLEISPLKPHPYLAKHEPGIQKLLLGQPLTKPEEDALYGRLLSGDERKLREALEPYISPAKIQEYRLGQALAGGDPTRALLSLDQEVGGLKYDPRIREKAPAIADLLEGKPLSGEVREKLIEEIGPTNGNSFIARAEIKTETPAHRRIIEEFRPELLEYFRQLNKAGRLPTSSLVAKARQWGIALGDIAPGLREPGGGLPRRLATPGASTGAEKLGDFGRKLAQSFAYIDQFDLARAIAKGNPEPWRIYDEPGKAPLADRWQAALGEAIRQRSPTEVQAALTGRPAEFRGNRVVAGGDIKLPGDSLGYARMTEEQVAALRDNPLLTVYAKDDPWPQHAGKKSFLVRYEYPSAANFEQLKGKVSQDLYRRLVNAKSTGLLKNEATPEFQKLTREILSDLWGSLRDKDPLSLYQRRVSIHPFGDYNGRLARVLYQAENNGTPLVMPQWDLDLLSPPAELSAHAAQGENAYRKVVQGLSNQEKAAPQFPRYFDTPEIFDTLLDLPSDARAPLSDLKNFLQSDGVGELLNNKEITQTRWRLWGMEGHRWEKLSEPERAATLASWIKRGYVPDISDEALFKKILDESKSLARGADAPAIARWWLQAAAGKDPAHGPAIHKFLSELKPELKAVFQKEWFGSEAPLRLPFSAAEKADFNGRIAAALGDPSLPVTEKERALRGFLRQNLAAPADAKRPLNETLKLAASYPDASFTRVFSELLADRNFPDRRELFEAAILLPAEQLDKITDTIWREIGPRNPNPPAYAAEIFSKASRRTDSKFGKSIAQQVLAGELDFTAIQNPGAMRSYLDGASIDGKGTYRFQALASDPAQSKKALQSFADRRQWGNFRALAGEISLDLLNAPDPAAKQLKAILKNGILRAGKAEPSLQFTGEIMLSNLEPAGPAKVAADERLAKRLLNDFGTPAFADNFKLFLDNSQGAGRINALLPAIFAGPPENLLGVLEALPSGILELADWKPEWEAAIGRAAKAASIEDQAKLIDRFAKERHPHELKVFSAIFREADPALQLRSLLRVNDLFPNAIPPEMIRAAVLSKDPKVRVLGFRDYGHNPKNRVGLAELVNRLLTKGEGELLKKPLADGWDFAVEQFLKMKNPAEAEKIRAAWAPTLMKRLETAPKNLDAAAVHTRILKFLGGESFPPEQKAKAAYTLLDALYGKTLSNESAKNHAASSAFRALRELQESGKAEINLDRLHAAYLKSHNADLLTNILSVADGADDSPTKLKILIQGLSAPSSMDRQKAVYGLGQMFAKPTATDADRALLKAGLDDFLKRDPTRTWMNGRTDLAALDKMRRLFSEVGISPAQAEIRITGNKVARKVASGAESCALRFQLFVPGKANQARGRLDAKRITTNGYHSPSIFRDPVVVVGAGAVLTAGAATADVMYSVLSQPSAYGEQREPYVLQGFSAAMKAATGMKASAEEWIKYAMMSELDREEKNHLAAELKAEDAIANLRQRLFRLQVASRGNYDRANGEAEVEALRNEIYVATLARDQRVEKWRAELASRRSKKPALEAPTAVRPAEKYPASEF